METLRSVCQNRFAQILAGSIVCLSLSNKYFESQVPKIHADEREPWWLSSIRQEGSESSSNQNNSKSCTRGVVDLDAFDRNCKKCIQAVIDQNKLEGRTTKDQKKKLRIATKSIRSVYLIQRFVKLIVDEDEDIFAGLLCFTAHEVLELVKLSLLPENEAESKKYSFKHLLLAYPVCDALSCQKLIEAQQQLVANSDSSKIKISAMIDSERQVEMLMNAWNNIDNNNNTLPTLWIDIDMSWKPLGIQSLHFGARRSALDTKEKVSAFLEKIEQLSIKYQNINIVDMIEGYQAYESQIAGFPDFVANSSLPCIVRKFLKSSCSNSSAVTNRRREILEADEKFRRTTKIVAGDLQLNKKKIEMNGGGSGSIKFSLQDPAVTEITVGSAALCGHQFDGYSQEPLFEPSLYFTLVATRQATPTIFTCHGGGWIASGDPGWYRLPKVVWPSSSKYLDFEGAGEVQTPIQVSEEDVKKILETESSSSIPSLFVFRPNKSGELGEVFAEYTLVCSRSEKDDEGNNLKTIKTYRGSGIHSWS